MYTIFTILFAGVCAYLGYLRGRHIAQASASSNADNNPNGVAPGSVESEREQVQSLLETIRELTNTMDDDVGRHSTTLEAVMGALQSSDKQSASAIVEATGRLLDANQHLQADLASAKAEIAAQREQLGSMATQALTDPLTGLDNRRSLDQELKRRVAQVKRHGGHVCFVMIDLDHFKKVNDRYGHLVGDELLRAVAGLLKRMMRDGDFVARYGGEEFACLLPNTSLEQAVIPAERIRCAVAAYSMRVGSSNVSPTVSLGVSACLPDDTAEQFVKRADQALYAAKGMGRNCCAFHDGQRLGQFETAHLQPALMDQPADMAPVTA